MNLEDCLVSDFAMAWFVPALPLELRRREAARDVAQRLRYLPIDLIRKKEAWIEWCLYTGYPIYAWHIMYIMGAYWVFEEKEEEEGGE